MSKNHYILKSDSINENTKLEIVSSSEKGFIFTPKNERNNNGIQVAKLVLINNTFIKNVIKRKTKRELDNYLLYVMNMIESEDDDSDTSLLLADLDRYKYKILNKYQEFLDRDYIEILLQKIKLMNRELKIRQVYLDSEKEIEKSTSKKGR